MNKNNQDEMVEIKLKALKNAGLNLIPDNSYRSSKKVFIPIIDLPDNEYSYQGQGLEFNLYNANPQDILIEIIRQAYLAGHDNGVKFSDKKNAENLLKTFPALESTIKGMISDIIVEENLVRKSDY